ncbi:MAG: hypothetical protein NVSMB68_00500 [Thermoanaerobaculia bacterium]
MSQSYEQSFRKITPVAELPEGQPKIFRAAGATVVLLRRGESVEAIDGSCVSDNTEMPAQVRLVRILECVAASASASPPDWLSLVERGGLAARIEDGWAWVCLDGCARE